MTPSRGDPQHDTTPETMLDATVTNATAFIGISRLELAIAIGTDRSMVENWFLTSDQRGALSPKPTINDASWLLLKRRKLLHKINCLHEHLLKHLGSEEKVNQFIHMPGGLTYCPGDDTFNSTATTKPIKGDDGEFVYGLDILRMRLEDWLKKNVPNFSSDSYWHDTGD